MLLKEVAGKKKISVTGMKKAEIIEALSKRDKEAAIKIIVRHVYNQELTVMKKIQNDDNGPLTKR